MADFRRCLYALALVALLAGLTVPASAKEFYVSYDPRSPTITLDLHPGDLVVVELASMPVDPPGTIGPTHRIYISFELILKEIQPPVGLRDIGPGFSMPPPVARRDTPLHLALPVTSQTARIVAGGPRLPLPYPPVNPKIRPTGSVDQFVRYNRS